MTQRSHRPASTAGWIALAWFPVALSAAPALPDHDSAAYVLEVRGAIVDARRADLPRQPASLAKLALALAVLEPDAPAGSLERVVEVSRRAAAMPPARLGLQAGDRMRVRDLLQATIVASSNDACRVLAEQFPGGVAGAVRRMNGVARALAMRSTLFADPCGFDRPEQQTTAFDLLLLARAALDQPEIADAARERSINVATADGRKTFSANTTNAMLAREGLVVGLKTGVTNGAGQSLILVARDGNAEIVVVLLGARDRWQSAQRLLSRGFEVAFDGSR